MEDFFDDIKDFFGGILEGIANFFRDYFLVRMNKMIRKHLQRKNVQMR